MARRISRAVVLIAGSFVLSAFIAVCGLYLATRHTPAFYTEALALEPEAARRGSDEFLETGTALANSIRREGKWYALVTEEQINGWLAVDLVENQRDLLPADVAAPRVDLGAGRATIACGYRLPGISAVVSVAFEVYLVEPRVVALRIHSTRAGALPAPMAPVVEGVARIAERLNLRVEWRQMHGDPVALITLPAAQSESMIYRLDALQLREGALYLMGCTESISAPGTTPAKVQPDVAALPDENRKVQ